MICGYMMEGNSMGHKWMKRAVTAVAGVALMFGVAAVPASAGTKTGTATCNAGSTIAVKGEQQRLVLMTLKVSSQTVYAKADSYTGSGVSSIKGTSPWSGTSEWLVWDKTSAYCPGIQ